MVIITSHNSLDFDGLASMVAAGKWYPQAVKVFDGTLSKNVKQFMALHKDSLLIKSMREININRVKTIVVVDTANPNRLGQLAELTRKTDLQIHIYDHHPTAPEDLRGSINEIHQVGAATTILVEKIMQNNIVLNPFEATILTLGIYEDTGSLIFASTTPRDVSAVAFLLGCGANLSVVANFMEQPFSSQQRTILQELMNTSRHYRINNMDVVIAVSENNIFIPGLDVVSFRLFEVENCDAAFIVALMDGKVNVVARSRTGNLRCQEILRNIGGRGHDRAASAVVRGRKIEEVVSSILNALGEKALPGLMVADIMSTPVKTLPMHVSMEEAGRIMLRYGHTGMPVVNGDRMVGVISRRDVDKAIIHELGHAPVKGFMTTRVVSIAPNEPLTEVQKLMIEHDIGRLPVVSEEKLVGIVSRTDILRTLHGEDLPEDYEVLYSHGVAETVNYAGLMQERLPSRLLYIIRTAGELGDELNCQVYCVGGFVRDLLLQVANFDLDLVIEGNGEEMVKAFALKLGGRESLHERFHTGVVILPDGTKVDFATARTEYYEFPAALPRVETSSIREDLYRRDFTINTLAICLNPERFGELSDYFGGRKDIDNGYIRILYNFSFVEDPTRILRAIRFEQRYNFKIEPDTLRFARDAIERRLLGKLSYKRIFQEFILILNENDPLPALDRMNEIGVWDYVMPEIKLEDIDRNTMRRIPVLIGWWAERYFNPGVKPWIVYIMLMSSGVGESELEHIMERYHYNKYLRKCMDESRQAEVILQEIIFRRLSPGAIDRMLSNWNRESLIYLLLCVRDEDIWELLIKYLDLKGKVRVEINGYDLKKMGVKQGPVYKRIFDELYQMRMNEMIRNREQEMEMVEKWMKEGYFTDADLA